ncbi:MAG: hypothetical protein KBF26_07890 [Opitutaceae bacterium]|nr:hypothetical protein [Opitutaceae bacterium]
MLLPPATFAKYDAAACVMPSIEDRLRSDHLGPEARVDFAQQFARNDRARVVDLNIQSAQGRRRLIHHLFCHSRIG